VIKLGRKLKGFKIGRTGYSVSNLRREKHGKSYQYFYNLNTPFGEKIQVVKKADSLPHLKRRIKSTIRSREWYM